MAILNVRPGDDRQARILSFDGVPWDAFIGHPAPRGDFRIRLQPGAHEVRVAVPGPCSYYDGTPGPGSSLATLRFSARAGVQYEVTLTSFPTQLFDLTEAHVYELVKPPFQVRAVEKVSSFERDPSSCAERPGRAQ